MDIPGLEGILAEYDEVITQIVNRPGDPVMPAGFSIVGDRTSKPDTDNPSVQDLELEQDSAAVVIRRLLSRFSKLPEKLIGGATSLVSMGIDSITALQFASLARKQGVFVAPLTVIQCANVRELLERIREERTEDRLNPASSSQSSAAEIQLPLADVISTTMPRHLRRYIEAIYPVSPGMEWMIGAWQKSGGYRYQHALVYRLHGRIDIRRLEESWDALLRFHPILRSTFCPVPAIKGNSDDLVALCVLDTSSKEKPLSHRQLPYLHSEDHAVAAEARMSVVHPSPTPGVHARLTVLEGRHDSYLLFNFHHFQYGECPTSPSRWWTNLVSADAGSLPLLVRHLEAIYLGLAFHCEGDLGYHLRSLLPTPQKRQVQEKYWREVFPPGWHPKVFTRSSPSRMENRANYLFRDVIPSPKNLREKARKSDVSLQAVLLAAWARVHSLECSASEATFGILHSNRFTDNLAVPCLNLLPIRIVDTQRPILEVARALMKDLQKRSGTLEQSKLRDVSEWAGFKGKPLCDVYVNVLHIGFDLGGGSMEKRLFEPVKVSSSFV